MNKRPKKGKTVFPSDFQKVINSVFSLFGKYESPGFFAQRAVVFLPAMTQAFTTTNLDLSEVPINDEAARRASLKISSKLMLLRKKPPA